jgi:hypothetical protein
VSFTDSTRLLAAALGLRVVADTTGLEADVAAKLTGVERLAVTTAERTSQQVGRIATVQAEKVSASTLRQSAAQETYNRLLRAGETDTVRLARAQAALLTARASVTRETQRAAEATAASSAVTKGDVEGGLLGGGLFGGLKGVAGVAAAAGLFATLRGGVKTYAELAGGVLSLQRATGATAPDASRLNAILEKFGVNGDRATQVMLRFGKNIADKPELLHKFGVEIAHNADGTVNMTKTLLNANQAFHDTPDAAQRASLALSLFGKGGQTLLPILAANRDTLKEFMAEAQQHGLIFSQDDIDRARHLALAQKNMTDAWQGFEITLARGVVPALTTVSRDAATVMDFLNQHQTVTRYARDITLVAGSLLAVNKGLRLIEAIRGSAIFARLFPVGQINAAAAANERLAASEVAVARAGGVGGTAGVGVAAGVGAGVGAAEGAAVGAGAAAAASRAGAPAIYSEMQALRATIPAAGAGALAGGLAKFGPAAVFTADVVLVPQAIHSLGNLESYGRALATKHAIEAIYNSPKLQSGSPEAQALAVLFPSVQEAYARASKGDFSALGSVLSLAQRAMSNPESILNQTPDAVAQRTAVTQARSTSTAAGVAYAANIDIFSNAPKIGARDPKAAAAVDTARTTAGDAARRVSIDEANLTALRKTGKATALQLARAEETLRLAKERSAAASDKVAAAEKKAHVPRLATAKSLLRTITSQEHRAGDDAKAVEKLYGAGLGQRVVAAIVQQNATAPGTLESVAKTITPKYAKAIQAEFRRLRFDGSVITGDPEQWRKAGEQRAIDFLDGVEAKFAAADPLAKELLPGIRKRARSGRLGSYNPQALNSRRRQRALSSVPRGA